MDKVEFDSLDIKNQIDYINNKLREFSLTSISKEIGIGRSTISERFKRNGYSLDKRTNQYIENDDSMTSVIHEKNDNSHTFVINNNLKANIIDLAENHEKIMKIIKWFESDDNSMTQGMTNIIEVVDEGIKINLPEETEKDFRTTIRVNKEIWEQFKLFSEKHREFTLKDLVSQSLKDFIDKNSK